MSHREVALGHSSWVMSNLGHVVGRVKLLRNTAWGGSGLRHRSRVRVDADVKLYGV